MEKILNTLVSGIVLFNACSEAPKGTEEKALELAQPLVEYYAERYNIPLDSLNNKNYYRVTFSEDSNNAGIDYYYGGHYEFGVNINFKKDTATFTVY
ncbi:MAG: hypothetical protein PHN52_04085 [candidate division Zixibacteria bacterium]|nr:hypothetical protein [candidate division Zixibacteria bacterium]